MPLSSLGNIGGMGRAMIDIAGNPTPLDALESRRASREAERVAAQNVRLSASQGVVIATLIVTPGEGLSSQESWRDARWAYECVTRIHRGT